MTKQGRVRLLLSLLVALHLAWGGYYVARTSFTHDGARVFSLWDDGMISMQYARNLREGHGPVWIPGGERVQGFSNPGPTLVMAGLHLLPVAPEHLSLLFQLLNLAMLAACPVLVWRIARNLFPTWPWVAGAAAVGTALCAPLAIWSLQGADVGFVTLWLLLCVDRLASRGGEPFSPGFAFLLGVGLLIRPDVALFYVVVLAAAVWLPGPRARRLLVGAAVLVLVEGALLLFGWLYYGDPLPNTYHLKATGAPRWLAIASAFQQLRETVPWLALLVALAAICTVRERRNPGVLLCAGLVGAALAYSIWVGGDWVFEYGIRYLAPVLPLALVLAIGAWWWLLSRWLPARAVTAAFAVTCLPLALLANPRTGAADWLDPRSEPMHRAFNANNYRFALYLAQFTRPSTSVGVHWGGVVPYFSRRPAVDVLGKSDRHIAKRVVTEFFPGHAKWDWSYVLHERKPDVIRGPSRGLGERQDFREGYWLVETGRGLRFYLRKPSVGKVRDPQALLVDQVTGQRTPLRRKFREKRPGADPR